MYSCNFSRKKPNRRNTAQEQKCKYAEIEEKLIEWLDEAKNEQMKINGILIKEMALTLAGILGNYKNLQREN